MVSRLDVFAESSGYKCMNVGLGGGGWKMMSSLGFSFTREVGLLCSDNRSQLPPEEILTKL